MALELSPSETRVLGSLLEKQLTTPDVYPLTLNSLRLACNQSTNREPVLSYDDHTIRAALHGLERRGLTRLASGAGSRAPKYRHLLAERLPMSEHERAIICVLMLRGHQTPGELKQRTERMHPFADLAAVQATLERLIGRELAVRLERRPGQKEERYAELLSDPDLDDASLRQPQPAPSAGFDVASARVSACPPSAGPPSAGPPSAGPPSAGPPSAALAELASRVERLERELAELRSALALSSGAA